MRSSTSLGPGLIALSLLASIGSSSTLKFHALEQQIQRWAESRLEVFEETMGVGVGGYLDYGYFSSPSSNQFPLETPYGMVSGFPSRRWVGLATQNAALAQTSWKWGPVYFFERLGFSEKDFWWMQWATGDTRLLWDAHFGGVSALHPASSFHLAFGPTYRRRVAAMVPGERPPLPGNGWGGWSHLGWGPLGFSTWSEGGDWAYLGGYLKLRRWPLLAPLGVYGPDIHLRFRPDEKGFVPNQVVWKQNIWTTKLAADLDWRRETSSTPGLRLHFFAGQERFIGLDLSLAPGWTGDVRPGFRVRLPLFSFGYDYYPDSETYFDVKGGFFLSFRFVFAFTERQWLFHPDASPMDEPLEWRRQ